MNTVIFIILTLHNWINVYSQHPTIDQLKKFATEADMSYYIDKAQQNLINDYYAQCEEVGFDELPGLFKQLEINLHKEQLVPILSVKFINTQNYNINDNIYDYMVVDSIRNFMFACINAKMNVKYFANYFDGEQAFYEIKNRRDKKLKKIIKHINSQLPELIIYCSSLNGFPDYNGFMFIKSNKIFIWNMYKNKACELNEYLNSIYKLDRIRDLNNFDKPVWLK